MYRIPSPPPPDPPEPKKRKPIKVPRDVYAFIGAAAALAIVIWQLPNIGFRGEDGAVIAVPELIGVACIIHLWRRPAPLWKRLFWSPVLLLPLIGPLLYGALFEPPGPQDVRASNSIPM
jgi:hypothetical protein